MKTSYNEFLLTSSDIKNDAIHKNAPLSCFFNESLIFIFLHNFLWVFQVDAQLQVVRKLEEKERLLQGTISTAERELALRTQALDMNKRKVTHHSGTISHSCRVQDELSFI